MAPSPPSSPLSGTARFCSYTEAPPAKAVGLWEAVSLDETVRGGVRVLGVGLGSSREGEETGDLSLHVHAHKKGALSRGGGWPRTEKRALAWSRSCPRLRLGLARLQNYEK